MVGKSLGVDCGRRDDDLQLAPLQHESVQVAQQEVDVERSLVRFIDDDRVVLIEPAVVLVLGEQNAVGHQLDVRLRRGRVGEPHLESDLASDGHTQLFRHTCRDRSRGNSARLSVTDQSVDAASQVEADLRQLRGLARSRFTANHDHAVIANGGRNLVAPLTDRQLLVVLWDRSRVHALLTPQTRFG